MGLGVSSMEPLKAPPPPPSLKLENRQAFLRLLLWRLSGFWGPLPMLCSLVVRDSGVVRCPSRLNAKPKTTLFMRGMFRMEEFGSQRGAERGFRALGVTA